MYRDVVRISFKHYKSGKTLEVRGILPEAYNTESSDLYVLLKQDGTLEDIRKETVIELEYLQWSKHE